MEKIRKPHWQGAENLLTALPIVELAGQNRLLIENHQGVMSYSPREIKIKVSYGCVIVTGENLQLMEMSKIKLAICGRICALQFFGG